MNNINDQKPATKNQITNIRPEIKKTANELQGYIANSINGGMVKPIAYKYVMAGEKHIEYRLRMNIKMLTPKTPAYQKLKATFKAFFVPNRRVWDYAEEFLAQKSSISSPPTDVPNMNGKTLYFVPNETDTNFYIPITDTDLWRDSWMSGYLPRFQTGYTTNQTITMPKYSILPFRGFKAIYNDFLRNKEYDEKLTEYTGNNVGTTEWQDYMMQASGGSGFAYDGINRYIIRGKRQNSYYTDYRTNLLGHDISEPTSGTNDLERIVEWEKLYAEMRAEASNAQLNDWDIIAKIRGAREVKDGKVQLLGTKTVGLNYQAVSQTAYNTNAGVQPEYNAVGVQGAYSYTEIDIPLYQMVSFSEEGYLHITMQISADTVFETGLERVNLNCNYQDIYRPDLKEVKHDVLYDIEKQGTRITSANYTRATGFKRKFSEYFKLPNIINGDMCSNGVYQTKYNSGFGIITPTAKTKELSQKSFQFFELEDTEDEQLQAKNIWEDYTDLMINKNQVVAQQVQYINRSDMIVSRKNFHRILGQNQVFFVGMQTCIAELPIDESIKDNFTKWGEL